MRWKRISPMDVWHLIESGRDSQVPLLDAGAATVVPLCLQTWWMVTHFLGFFTGGTSFIAGTVCYYYPEWAAGALVAVEILKIQCLSLILYSNEAIY